MKQKTLLDLIKDLGPEADITFKTTCNTCLADAPKLDVVEYSTNLDGDMAITLEDIS